MDGRRGVLVCRHRPSTLWPLPVGPAKSSNEGAPGCSTSAVNPRPGRQAFFVRHRIRQGRTAREGGRPGFLAELGRLRREGRDSRTSPGPRRGWLSIDAADPRTWRRACGRTRDRPARHLRPGSRRTTASPGWAAGRGRASPTRGQVVPSSPSLSDPQGPIPPRRTACWSGRAPFQVEESFPPVRGLLRWLARGRRLGAGASGTVTRDSRQLRDHQSIMRSAVLRPLTGRQRRP